MAKILFFPYSHQLGTTYALIDLAKYFQKLGDDITFAAEGQFSNEILKNGFKIIPISEIDYQEYRKYASQGNINFYTEEIIKKHIQEELEIFEEIKPDLLIGHGRYTLRLSAEIAQIKLINLCMSIMTGYYGLPMILPESLGTISKITKIPFIGQLIQNNANTLIGLKGKIMMKTFKKIIKEYKISRINSYFDLNLGTYLTLIPESEELFPLKPNYPKNKIKFTGPLLSNKYLDIPNWYNYAKEKDGNFIYLSMGSSSLENYPIVLNKLIEIFGEKKDYYIITNTAHNIDLKDIKNKIPSNFFVSITADASKMLDLADIIICHGGKGTIYHALINGVPILGIPGQAEQEMNLNRIKQMKLGDYILSSEIKTIENNIFKDKIENVLKNNLIQKNVIQIGSKIRKEMSNIKCIVNNISTEINNES